MKKLLLISALVPLLVFGQTRKQRKALAAQKKADQQVITNLKTHNQFFLNREAQPQPSSQEAVVDYISNQFKILGLQPKGTNAYLQQFKIDEGKEIDAGTFLRVNGTLLTVKKDYYPLPFSSSSQVAGMPAMALKEKGVPWFVDIKDWLEDNADKPDSFILKTAVREASRAASKGATALFLYNSGTTAARVPFYKKDKTSTVSIPVVYVTSNGYKKYFTDDSQVLDIELKVAFKQVIKNATNVVGHINNGAATNVIIATAYDEHVGSPFESIDGNDSLNAPGGNVNSTALLIEIARMLSAYKAKNNNYTIIAYTADDSISSNSKWLNSTAIPSEVNYILNLGKLARFDESKTLVIATNERSEVWADLTKTLENSNVEVAFDSMSLRANSNFANSLRVPVLNLFVSDSNVTTANYSRLNYEGELNIAKYIYRLIEATDNRAKIPFSGGNAAQTSQAKMAAPVSSSLP